MTNDPYKSVKDIKHELQNNFSKVSSIWIIYTILKANGFSYIAPRLGAKADYKIRSKRPNWCKRNKSRDWSNIIFMNEWIFYLYPPKGKKLIKKGRTTLIIQVVASKKLAIGVFFLKWEISTSFFSKRI